MEKTNTILLSSLLLGPSRFKTLVRVDPGLGTICLGSEKYEGSDSSGVRNVRIHLYHAGSWPSCKLTLLGLR